MKWDFRQGLVDKATAESAVEVHGGNWGRGRGGGGLQVVGWYVRFDVGSKKSVSQFWLSR